jgi:hypothetical protein
MSHKKLHNMHDMRGGILAGITGFREDARLMYLVARVTDIARTIDANAVRT